MHTGFIGQVSNLETVQKRQHALADSLSSVNEAVLPSSFFFFLNLLFNLQAKKSVFWGQGRAMGCGTRLIQLNLDYILSVSLQHSIMRRHCGSVQPPDPSRFLKQQSRTTKIAYNSGKKVTSAQFHMLLGKGNSCQVLKRKHLLNVRDRFFLFHLLSISSVLYSE